MCNQQRLRPACAYAQSDQSRCKSLEYSMNIKLLNEYHLEFLSLKGGCTGLSESIHVKMPHCWKSHVAAHWPIFSQKNAIVLKIITWHPYKCTIDYPNYQIGRKNPLVYKELKLNAEF